MLNLKTLQKNTWLIAAISGLVGSVVGFLIGDGALFRIKEIKLEQIKLESDLMTQLRDYERDIHELVPKYTLVRDKKLGEEEIPYPETLEYYRLRAELIAAFSNYNKTEARLSQLQERGAQFLLAAYNMPPPPPKSGSVTLVPDARDPDGLTTIKVTVVPAQEDEVVTATNSQLSLLLEQYDQEFRNEYYRQACKAKQPHFCTFLAQQMEELSRSTSLTVDESDLYQQGCAYGDPIGCEKLAFDEFKNKRYQLAEQWLVNACDLGLSTSCTNLGVVRASELLGERQDAAKAIAALEKACELENSRGCYYGAIIHISGLIDRDELVSKARLEKACALGLEEACKSLAVFDDFKLCSPKAMFTPEGEASPITVECKEPESTRSDTH